MSMLPGTPLLAEGSTGARRGIGNAHVKFALSQQIRLVLECELVSVVFVEVG